MDDERGIGLWVVWKRTFVRASGRTLTVGRDPSCDVVLAGDAGVSRRHARFTLLASAIKLEDLNSSNGTYVDGHRLSGTALLSGGEWVRVGGTELRAYRTEAAFRQAVGPVAVPRRSTPGSDLSISTVTSNLFGGLVRDVARAVMTKPEEVEALVADALDTAEALAREGRLGPADAGIVADLAFREARGRREGRWVTRILQLYRLGRLILPPETARRLVASRGSIRDFPEEEVGGYLAVLATLQTHDAVERRVIAATVAALTEEVS